MTDPVHIQITGKNAVRFEFKSELHLVERVLHDAEDFFKRHRKTKEIEILLTLRELLINAIVHGNRNSRDKKVSCSIEILGDGRIQLVVSDQGDGFRHKSVNMSLPEDPKRVERRGLALAKHLSERLEFNATGNCVKATFKGRNEKKAAQAGDIGAPFPEPLHRYGALKRPANKKRSEETN